jgi:hypothetical protein
MGVEVVVVVVVSGVVSVEISEQLRVPMLPKRRLRIIIRQANRYFILVAFMVNFSLCL